MTQNSDVRFDDTITDLLFQALRQSRAARHALEHDLPRHLPHTSRPFAARIAKRCFENAVFDSTFDSDLDALICELDKLIAAETLVEVQCDPDTGMAWEDHHLTQHGEALDRAATTLRKLRSTLEAVADAKAAETMRCAF